MRIFISACVVAWLSASHSVAQTESQAVHTVAAEWGTVNDGLRMAISSLPSENAASRERRFSVAIENVGDHDVVLNLGYMLANGKVMFPTAVAMIVADARGQTRELRYFDRRYPGVAGRVDDFTVALRAGSVHVLRLSLDHYSSTTTGEVTSELAPGRYRVEARLDATGASSLNLDTQGIGLMNFWKGTLRSNSVEFVRP
jgi:hypothetical protein